MPTPDRPFRPGDRALHRVRDEQPVYVVRAQTIDGVEYVTLSYHGLESPWVPAAEYVRLTSENVT